MQKCKAFFIIIFCIIVKYYTYICITLLKDIKMKYLIGGARMVELGSDRRTEDTDYLINDPSKDLFTHDVENNIDYINAAKHPFYAEIWEAANEGITPQLMLEMKAFSLIQHLNNRSFNKVPSTEYDMNRLAIDHNVRTAPIAAKYMSNVEYNEVLRTIKF